MYPQSNVPVKKPAVDRLDEDTVRRKTSTIVDEFAENKDSKVVIIIISIINFYKYYGWVHRKLWIVSLNWNHLA